MSPQNPIPFPYSLSKSSYDVPRSNVAYIANNIWNVRKSADLFKSAQLLYWSAGYTLAKLLNGRIINDGDSFNVIFHQCTWGDIFRLPPNAQVALSFRIPADKYQIPATVLIRLGDI